MYDNIAEAAAILDGGDTGNGYFSLSVYPPSVPVNLELIKSGVQAELMASGAVFKPCFCGPCFGAGDVPGNGCLSIRHTTRNFPNREGSRPGDGQLSGVALMDARSIAATAANGGAHGGHGYRLPRPRKTGLRRDGIRKAGIFRLRKAGRGRSAALRPQHHGMAGHTPHARGHKHGARLRHPRPRHHHRRAHTLRARPAPTAPIP
jgi:hypothetical protein